MKPTDLPLRDIHLPAPVSWWPLAPGWWVSLALLLVSGVLLAWWWRGAPTRRARRAALDELAAIESDFARHNDGHACAKALSRLLRRLALLAGDVRAARSSGASLQSVLAGLHKTPLPPELLELVREAPYSPAAAAAIDAQRYRAATDTLRLWLRGLRVPRASHKLVSHAAV
jgi:hypothetical protein